MISSFGHRCAGRDHLTTGKNVGPTSKSEDPPNFSAGKTILNLPRIHPNELTHRCDVKPDAGEDELIVMGTNLSRKALWIAVVLALFSAMAAGPASAAGSGGGAKKLPSSRSGSTLSATTNPLPEFGTQFHGMWSSYTDTQRAMVLDTLKANGVTTVRLDVSWAMLNPTSATWDTWGTNFVTRVLKMITDRGMKPMVMVWLTPKWVSGTTDDRVAPRTTTQLARWETFNRQLAAKFPQVTNWEIWNEPNHNDFMRGASPYVYAKVLASGYRGIKAGNPNARVIFAGTQFVDTPWITKALKAGAKGKYDIMGVHPYMAVANLSPDSPDTDGIWRLRHVPSLRSAMLAVGDNKPMWFTEFGWRVGSTGTANWQLGVDEATQAKYLATTLRIVREEYPYVTNVYWYRELADNNTSTSSGYGLIQPDGRVKPALAHIHALYHGG